VAGRQLLKRGQAAPIALDGDDAAGALGKQRAGEPARPRPDLDRRALGERPGGASDPSGQVEVEDEILAEAPARRDAVAGDDLPQRRQRGGAKFAQRARSVLGAPRRHLGSQPQRRDQAVRPRHAFPGDIETGAVIGGSADERQS
jgi:hypothetical protein